MLKDLAQGEFSLESNEPPDTMRVPTPDAQGSHATTACSKQKKKSSMNSLPKCLVLRDL